MRGFIDYRMVKRAVVREVTRGVVAVEDVCDAHPELLRAARNVGTPTSRTCPICRLADDRADVPPPRSAPAGRAGRVDADQADTLRLVTYVFGEDLKRLSGHVVWTREELDDLAEAHRSFTAYVVECCLACGWNHLVESYLLGRAYAG